MTKSHWPISILSTLSSLVNMLLPLILVRILKPEEIGLFKIFFLYITIFPAFSFMTGVLNGLSYWAGQEKQGVVAVRMSSLLTLVSAFFLFIMTWIFRAQVTSFLGWDAKYVSIFCLGLLGSMASSFYEEIAIARGKIWTGALFSSGMDLVRTASVLVAAVVTHSLYAIFLAYAVTQSFKTVVGYILGWRQGMVGFKWDTKVFRAVWHYAFPVSVAWGFGILVSYSDQMILSKYISPADFAFYSIGCLTVPPLVILEVSVTRVLIPQMAGAFSQGNVMFAAALFRKAVADLAYLTIPAVTGMIVFAKPIIEMLFTTRYSSASSYLMLYSLFYLSQIIPNDAVPRARGEGKWILWNFTCFSLLTLGACWGMTYKFGPFGTLVGLISSRIVMKAYAIYYLKKTTPWKLGDFLPFPDMLRSVTVCLGLSLICLLLKPLFASGLAWFLTTGALFSIFYFVLTIMWGHHLNQTGTSERKVLMLAPYLGIGGLERMILNLSITLKEQAGWQPEVFAYDHPADAPAENHLLAEFAEKEIPVQVHCKGPGFSPKAVFKIARHVLNAKIRVIHSHDLGALIYGVGAKVATLNRVKLVHTQHSFVHLNRRKRYEYYERFFTFFVDELAVVSDDTKETYVKLGLSPRKIHVVPNGVFFTESPALERSRKLEKRGPLVRETASLAPYAGDSWLLYMARIHGRKGQDHAISLWNALPPEQRRGSVLLFVGPETEAGRLAQLRSLIATAHDSDRIIVVGPAQKPHLWLEACDVSLSCSEFEGMPLGPIEAAGSGLPLVLSRIAGHEILSGNSHQYDLANPVSGADALGRAMEQALRPDGFNELGRSSTLIRSGFSLEAMATRYTHLYQRRSKAAALLMSVAESASF